MTDIHPTAIVQKGAEIDAEVAVGPYCVIGPHVKIGRETKIMGHVYLDGWTTIGPQCVIFPFASIGTQTQDLKYKGGITFVEIGEKTTLREYVTVNSGTNEGDVTRVGARCHIMAYSHVAHQCLIGNEVIISNAGTLAGHVVVEDGAIIGGLCGIHQFVRVGRMCIIGGCSKANQDIAPFMMADGNPAAIHGLNTVGLQRRNVPPETQNTLKKAHRIIFRQNLTVQQALEKIKKELSPCPELEHLTAFIASSERGIAR
ncbi:MAG: acyl-ACP--UDP-N-acetylglucosamine O-acyltransferase [Kiritimatiellae bacterium]|jgi:UDP-N-acetylglucosamine acyltransferase|nr:acyl-ACP--UDP-N-acetylglucosamine O-acyltransferase [Kiritimatiellia bacterium]